MVFEDEAQGGSVVEIDQRGVGGGVGGARVEGFGGERGEVGVEGGEIGWGFFPRGVGDEAAVVDVGLQQAGERGFRCEG